jgi:hypothetical protein
METEQEIRERCRRQIDELLRLRREREAAMAERLREACDL